VVAFPSITKFNPWDATAVREFMRPFVEPWFKKQAWVHIIDPLQKVVATNFETGVTTVTVTPLWSGWARVQPLRTALNSKQPYNATTTRVIQFWIDFPADGTEPDLRAGLEIAVESGGNDPALQRHQFVLTGAINSNQAWQRTIETVVNFESRPNYDMSHWIKPVYFQLDEDGNLYFSTDGPGTHSVFLDADGNPFYVLGVNRPGSVEVYLDADGNPYYVGGVPTDPEFVPGFGMSPFGFGPFGA